MRRRIFFLTVVLLVSVTGAGQAMLPPEPHRLAVTQSLPPGSVSDDARLAAREPARTDTFTFGFYEIREDGQAYAVLGDVWSFDHGASDPLEGFTAVDFTANEKAYFRHMTAAQWQAEGGPPPAPLMNGAGFALCGNTKGYADSLGWAAGIGYGNEWCQRLTSPGLTYDGEGAVDLSFRYFNQTELEYDYTHVFVETDASREEINSPGFQGLIGMNDLGVLDPATYVRTITNLDFGSGTVAREFRIVVEFRSDGMLSDEDGEVSPVYPGGWDAFYGPFGLDDVVIGPANLVPPAPVTWGFEGGLEGWTASKCPGIGSFEGVAPLSQYAIQDPCSCTLSGNVLEMHDDLNQHPRGQHVALYSPIIDREGDLGPGYAAYNRVLAEWDDYEDLPLEGFVLFRPGWSYFPYEQPAFPGLFTWSPRVGNNTFYYSGGPVCRKQRDIGTSWGLPPDAPQVKFIYELLADYDTGVPPPDPVITNFSPLLDNITVRTVAHAVAPVVVFEPGTRFQDGFGQSVLLSPADPGNANIVFNLHMGSPSLSTRLGDSLMIRGPVPVAASRWEAKLWFRLKRLGPNQDPSQGGPAVFATWKQKMMLKGIDFFTGPDPDFTWGYMDSVEIGTAPTGVLKYEFCSQFRDGPSSGGQNLPADVCFNWGGGGEQGEGNEILPDLCFTPGTKVEYFISSNYTCTPNGYYVYPDTSGGAFSEFEILPSYRLDEGTPKFPCLLYVDASNIGTQFWIENALNVVMNGAQSFDPVPDPTRWDRYDYLDAASHWSGPFYRQLSPAGANNGATTYQLLGYRVILFSSGRWGQGCTDSRDWDGLRNWLDFNGWGAWPQGLIADGNRIGEVIGSQSPSFLSSKLGATSICVNYSNVGCPPGEVDNDTQDCVRIEPATGTPFGTGIPTDVFGNWCPSAPFGVLGTVSGSGSFGNKSWKKIGSGTETPYAQVISDHRSEGYRTVIESWSYDDLTVRDAGDPGVGECAYDDPSEARAARADAVIDELGRSLAWVTVNDYPHSYGLCVEPPGSVEGVDQEASGSGVVTRLYQNQPNPFNPRTSIRFSLAVDGPAKLVIFDVGGRRVRLLVDENLKAGMHEAVWDGADDTGRLVTSGLYWSQLRTNGYASNKKMIVLK